jgi:hypothetical protein
MINPTYKGFFLPKRSSKGPDNNCPTQIPIKKLDKEKPTFSIVVCRSSAITLKPGRYMSMESGPIAVSMPNIKMIRPLLFVCNLFIKDAKYIKIHQRFLM